MDDCVNIRKLLHLGRLNQRAPASIAMLQMVMRPSIERPLIAEPANSMTYNQCRQRFLI